MWIIRLYSFGFWKISKWFTVWTGFIMDLNIKHFIKFNMNLNLGITNNSWNVPSFCSFLFRVFNHSRQLSIFWKLEGVNYLSGNFTYIFTSDKKKQCLEIWIQSLLKSNKTILWNIKNMSSNLFVIRKV